MPDYPHEFTAQQRAALITVRLLRGERLSNSQVAEICGYTSRASAYLLMMRLAGLREDLSLTYSNGVWYVTESL